MPWQDLVDTCGFAAGYFSVRRYITVTESSPGRGVVCSAHFM